MQEQPDHLPRRLWLILAALWVAWGFNWAAIKVALADVTPWTFRSLCLAGGSAVLYLALRSTGADFRVAKGERLRLAMLAFFNITLWNLLVAFGLTMIPAGRGAILAYMMPAWSIPLSVWLLHERLTARKMLGLALGMLGLAVLLGERIVTLGEAPLGSLLVLGASVSWAVGTVLQKRFPMSMQPGPYTVWIMFLGGVPIFIGALVFDDLHALGSMGTRAAIGVAYNVVIAFAFAHWAWIKIATAVPVSVFSLSMLVIPVLGVVSGMVFLGERPTLAEYGALALVLASLLSVVLPARQAR